MQLLKNTLLYLSFEVDIGEIKFDHKKIDDIKNWSQSQHVTEAQNFDGVC